MSVEGPEAHIVAGQMNRQLSGHRVIGCQVHDVAKLQPSGFVNRDLSDFERLVGGTVEAATSRGNTIKMALDNGTNLVIGPEYGGRILLHEAGAEPPAKTHLMLGLDDGRTLSVRLTGMGSLRCETDDQLKDNYVYRRDFSDTPDPTEEPLTAESFEEVISTRPHALKSVLVGKEAAVVGISNSAFQDIIYRAGLHPKRKASDLAPTERRRLHQALRTVVEERLRLGGKSGFVDLHGREGRYEPAMGPNHKGTACQKCGEQIDVLAMGGGRVYYCPGCQR